MMSVVSRIVGRGLGLPPVRTPRIRVARDLSVPMADGVSLLADRYYPADGRAPLVLIRTPYGRGSMGLLARLIAARGYQVLVVSLRGTAGSGGRFTGWELDAADGPALVRWLRGREWFPEAFATYGASFLGYAQWELAGEPIPEWKAAIIQDAPSEVYETFLHRGGAFALHDWLGWTEVMHTLTQARGSSALRELLRAPSALRRVRRATDRLPLTEADRAATGTRVDYFQDWLHRSALDPYWSRMDHRDHVAHMPPVVHIAGGWQDIFLPGTLADYAALRDSGRQVRLLVGPWTHGRGMFTRAYQQEAFAVLDSALRGEAAPGGPPVRVFVPGNGRWRRLTEWPPVDHRPRPWYLRPEGGLGEETPGAGAPSRYRYDPAEATPSVGGPTLRGGAGPRDNRRLEARPDVLTFTGSPLRDDLDVAGPVTVEIHVRSNRLDTDVFARLCDVAPNGRSVNVCDGIRRLTAADVPESDGTRRALVSLWPTAYRFRHGHRLRLQISGGAHPRYVRNLGTGDQLGTELLPADQEILHDPDHPSALLLPVAADR